MSAVYNSKAILFCSIAVTILLLPLFANLAFAQYMGNVGTSGQTGAHTLEETLQLAKAKVTAAEKNPQTGSGTPYLDANGVIGASIIAGAVFGGIAGAFFFMGRKGKYAAQGRG